MERQDHLKTALVALTSALGPIGGPLAVLLQDYIPGTMAEKQKEAMRLVGEDLKRLEKRLDDSKLRSEAFHITLVKTLRMMSLERHPDKLEAFRGIVANEALKPSDGSEAEFFLGVTENLTGEHIRLLKILANPEAFANSLPDLKKRLDGISMGGIGALLEPAFPKLTRGHLESMLDDIYRKSLGSLKRDSYGITMSRSGIMAKTTTKIGDDYLQFISLPPECKGGG